MKKKSHVVQIDVAGTVKVLHTIMKLCTDMGHTMTRWVELKKYLLYQASCQRCGKSIKVDFFPSKEGKKIIGLATARRCKD